MKEFKEISKAAEIEIKRLWRALKSVIDNRSLTSMEADECSELEPMLGIIPLPDDPLEDRVRRVKGYCEMCIRHRIYITTQRTYLEGLGKDVTVNGSTKKPADLSDDEVKVANTGSHVFLRATVVLMDAIEDVDLIINV